MTAVQRMIKEQKAALQLTLVQKSELEKRTKNEIRRCRFYSRKPEAHQACQTRIQAFRLEIGKKDEEVEKINLTISRPGKYREFLLRIVAGTRDDPSEFFSFWDEYSWGSFFGTAEPADIEKGNLSTELVQEITDCVREETGFTVEEARRRSKIHLAAYKKTQKGRHNQNGLMWH